LKTSMIFFIFFLFVIIGFSQENKIQWKRTTDMEENTVSLFHAIQTANLPTAETLRKNEFEYEISHRFINTVDKKDTYFGIDGPAHIRMALSYAIMNDLLMTFGRSNLDDNIDIRLKYKLLKLPGKTFPMLVAIQGGTAWNTEVYDPLTAKKRDKTDSKNFQFYGQGIFNTMIFNKLGIGFVPSYVYNSNIYSNDTKYTLTFATYLQYYFSAMWSLFAETNSLISGWRNQYNPITLGFQIETGGHFFKIFFTNSQSLNPTQYLTGADLNIRNGDWRLGFDITRILKF